MPVRREALLKSIAERISAHAVAIKATGVVSPTLEDLVARLLNLTLGWKLRDLNRSKPNFPGIDIGDDDGHGVQVTVETSLNKVWDTLARMAKHDLGNRFPYLIVFFFAESAPNFRVKKPNLAEFGVKSCDLWSLKVLVRHLGDKPISTLEEIDSMHRTPDCERSCDSPGGYFPILGSFALVSGR